MDHLRKILKNELQFSRNSREIEGIIFDIIFNHVKDLLFIIKVEEGPKFRYLFANENALQIEGMTKESIGKLIEEVLPKKISRQIYLECSRFFNGEEDVQFTEKIKKKDGTYLFSESIFNAIKDEYGKISYIVCAARDITESVGEKKRIIESQQRYRSVIDHNLDAIFSLNEKGVILSTNRATYDITGYSEKQLTGRSIFHLFHDRDSDKFRKMFRKTYDGYAQEFSECRFIHKKGTELVVHLKTVPIVINGEIDGIYAIMRDITDYTENLEIISYMAFHDQLTGLLNRAALIRDLKVEIKKNQKQNTEFALLNIDLDRFKYLNDTMGHEAGDLLLKNVGQRLLSMKYKNFEVYRQGGDEFNILLKNTDEELVNEFVAEIFKVFNIPFQLKRQEYFITPSIGISMYPFDGHDSEMLIRKADGALYQVKEKGKAHYQFYNTGMTVHFPGLVMMESQLRRAIENRELILYYQPQVDLHTNETTSFEALLRWANPILGFVSPGEFIPLAEDTGLIISIGDWVIEEVCRQLRSWEDKGIHGLKIGVNLSPKQFTQPSLCERIAYLLKKYSLKPSSLEIEITEGAMQDTAETIKILDQMKEIGLSISVDDFGTGYSSLSYLKQFPLDTLKIDQSFVKEILFDKKDAAITNTIIHLANSLGLEVIAEGVETTEQAGFLKDANCSKAQGFLFSKPVPAEELFKHLIPV
ncbi:bifunctional diguanylate cyclase/phosphodiesterase [Peribacillus glennii]|uniref:Bifunctional diguanylate cyclase/phosphodiesterase n=2 Tax=Peribacillus glennii TaxID=2303991 RepID=A0A372LC65_9BACI|nr:bifunctional diguanylate cyclase/phosphodiesterase [Peribacillus glennii]